MEMLVESLTITKIEAARRQLRTAIELWFADGDVVSIHTLATAAHQVIHDLNRRRQGPEMLFDTVIIKDEYRKDFINMAKGPTNFFKHADKDPLGEAATVELHPGMTELFILFANRGIELLGQQPNDVERAYSYWHSFHTPRWLSKAGEELLQRIPVENLLKIRELKKLEFFQAFLSVSEDARTGSDAPGSGG
jgi:hypothetical protein